MLIPELADAFGGFQAGPQTLSFRRKGTGPTLVLIHGFLGGSAMWRAQVRAFAATRDVVAPDLAGFGDSAALSAPDKIEVHARMVLDLLKLFTRLHVQLALQQQLACLLLLEGEICLPKRNLRLDKRKM